MDLNKVKNTLINGNQFYYDPNNLAMNKLVVIHNAGFFSCSSIALMDILIYFNGNQYMPEQVDRSAQYSHYKKVATENLIPFYFLERHTKITYSEPVLMMNGEGDFQYMDYRLINFKGLQPFLYKFFQPGQFVLDTLHHFEWKYQIDYENTCAVFYRANDKARETVIAPYESFIEKAQQVLDENPSVQFLVQPDETEFLEAFYAHFPDNTFHIEETPHMSKKDSCIPFEMAQNERAEYGARYFAAVMMISKCKHIILHSGNGAWWAVAYRGHGNNIHQNFNNEWIS